MSKLSKSFTVVTPLIKALAFSTLIVFFILGFFLRRNYQINLITNRVQTMPSWNVYTNKTFNYSIEVPKDWIPSHKEFSGIPPILIIREPQINFQIADHPNLNFSIIVGDNITDNNDYNEHYLNQPIGKINQYLTKIGNITMDGTQAVEYEVYFPINETRKTQFYAYKIELITNTRFYEISLSSENPEEVKPFLSTFNQVLSTFKFIN